MASTINQKRSNPHDGSGFADFMVEQGLGDYARNEILRSSQIEQPERAMKTGRLAGASSSRTAGDTSCVDSWASLTELVRQNMGDGWIYRGQSAVYPLLPKIGRRDSKKDAYGKCLPYSKADELKILSRFERESRPYLSFEPRGALEWLAVAQHHGMPTRLLDWTESLLVAAYFAVERAGIDGPPAVFGIRKLPVVDSAAEWTKLRKPMLYQPPHISPRITAQRSVFTVHPQPSVEFRSAQLKLWKIESKACFSIKKALDACGINEASLFPGLDGLARYWGWRYKRSSSRPLLY